ncbi:MAG: 2TM domain-containing protein [Alphaproteobacteria bacterium]|nr:2TM domain-containing protein [Alphaproteobacteria bacterium]
MSADLPPETAQAAGGPERRLRGFAIHLAVYFGVMVLVVPVNLYFSPDNLWFVLPMIGWGSVLALHVAYVMGLFGVFAGSPDNSHPHNSQ